MPIILRTSNIIINNGSSNFTMDTVKSKLIINSVEDPKGAQ
jgi:hypothetical protein